MPGERKVGFWRFLLCRGVEQISMIVGRRLERDQSIEPMKEWTTYWLIDNNKKLLLARSFLFSLFFLYMRPFERSPRTISVTSHPFIVPLLTKGPGSWAPSIYPSSSRSSDDNTKELADFLFFFALLFFRRARGTLLGQRRQRRHQSTCVRLLEQMAPSPRSFFSLRPFFVLHNFFT